MGDEKTEDKQRPDGINAIIGVVGTGVLGIQISSFLLFIGKNVILKTRDISHNQEILSRISKRLDKLQVGMPTSGLMERLTVVDTFDMMSSCNIVIEAVKEDLGIKNSTFKEVSRHVPEGALIMTNSSSLSIDSISAGSLNESRCVGFHMFNPVDKMELVEIVVGKSTSTTTATIAASFALEIGKRPIMVIDSPGFIVNRLLFIQMNEAIRMMENGVATKEDIDQAMKLGLKHPMGPFELADFIGLDICCAILDTICEELEDEKYRPARSLIDLVSNKKLGKKSGEGFYQYRISAQK